ncbi:class I SAM-dependent methyltransferase [Nitrosovibrio tenuis]|uniref:Methyltransferase domain-containing protein n=1 Tax=Nitrosovibrio tenuis TaxID=1233 RepID=A0A1H7FU52_9PROT|nr:class I SAM-dependent methyltransferase [Nitrosovibrio tenuis]SEK28012.1 Methyltransferase domain-containing protein [Nitrosovibrio tenuis]
MLRDKVLHYIFNRYMAWRLDSLLYPAYPVLLDYPIDSHPRYGHGKPPHPLLSKLIESNREKYGRLLSSFLNYADLLAAIPADDSAGPDDPSWCNPYFMGLDAAALYSFLALKKPAIFFEIGSGNSTKFARRSITDHGLDTKIISCDPYPRAEIDAICDQVIRSPAEGMDLALLDQLEPGDILFVDNSHRVFMNSDATVVFLDILPRLKKGVIVHIHDVFLPLDYPPQWEERYYSEQYLLAAWLLAEGPKFEILLPNVFVSQDERLSKAIQPLWDRPELNNAYKYALSQMYGFQGFSFWLQANY